MEFKQIQELIKQVNRSHLTELHIEQDNFKITIKKGQKTDDQGLAASPLVNPVVAYPAPQAPIASAPAAPAPEQPAPSKEKAVKKEEDANLITIKSPMIGTFYRSPGPDKPAFVNVGDEVAPGKVVCIIEAMKLFNEVESEVSGKIVKILVEEASPVEYDQPLFLIEP